ncbi:MAG: thiosulfate oxidation carrier protein SoxY, partial [Burkholderiaceae bacterium]
MKSKRRRFISASAAGLALLAVDRLHASPDRAQATLRAITRGAAPEEARVELDIPPLVENGNLVVLNVRVQSPMTADDFVKTIYIVAEGNPLP